MNKQDKEKILSSDLLPVAETLQSDFKKSGQNYLLDCQKCGKKKGLNVNPSKGIFKCFACGSGGNNPVKLLQEQLKMSYYDALREVASINNIKIDPVQTHGRASQDSDGRPSVATFAELQLRQSGLFISQLSDRYVSGTLDHKYQIIDGDDMVLVYKDLDGEPMTWVPKGRVKKQPLYRVRYKVPEHHLDKSGKPVKYRSPYGSGSHLWLPDSLISSYQAGQQIESLFITEGEKKADLLSLHGLPSVGIMGIHNFATSKNMPLQFERIIRECGVKQVIFLLDSDYLDISDNPEKPVHLRTWSFFTAVDKYRHYFYAFNSSGIHLDILFGSHQGKEKGIDDHIHQTCRGKEKEAIQRIQKALKAQSLKNKEFYFNRITEKGSYQLKEYFKINNAESFFEHHKKKLKELGTFKYFKIQYRVNDQGEIEMAQKILPGEQYWEWKSEGNKTPYVTFKYNECRKFLRNRNIGRYEANIRERMTIQIEEKVVREIDHIYCQNYLLEHTEQLNEPAVLEKILSGIHQYLGPQRLNNLYPIEPQFIDPDPQEQIMVFQDKYWRITAAGITEEPITNLPGDIWKDHIIDFSPKLQNPDTFLQIERNKDKWTINADDQLDQFDWFQFLKCTSYFAWREHQVLGEDPATGRKKYFVKEYYKMTTEQYDELINNLVPKIIASGYLMHQYNNLSDMRAVVCVDGVESEVGKSEGGTGKSLFTHQFTYSLDTVGINGKKRDLESDPFIYDSVTPSTRLIYFDDCRIGLDFEHFFSQITKKDLEINVKNQRKFFIDTPRFIFNTNHAFRRDSHSFRRRQYIISFSDYFNEHRTPMDEFGRQFFHDWQHKDWNLYYNFIAHCIRTYLKFGLKYEAPDGDVMKRNLRQRMGENFLEWAMDYWNPNKFGEETKINHKVDKKEAYEDFIELYPTEKRYTNIRIFKSKVLDFIKYIEHELYTPEGRTRYMSGSTEYLVIADDKLDANDIPYANPRNQPSIF